MFSLFKILSENGQMRRVLNKKLAITLFRQKHTRRLLPFDERNYIIVHAMPNDYNAIVDLFKKSYYTAEPTILGAGLGDQRNAFFDCVLMHSLYQGMSLMAVCRHNGAIAGAAINAGKCCWDPDLDEHLASNCGCPKMAELFRFYGHVARHPNLWSCYNERKIYEVSFATTGAEYRGKGLGSELIRKSLELGKDLGYNVLRVDATGEFTHRICRALNMTLIHTFYYKDYRGTNGKVLLYPPPPHEALRIYISLPHAPKT